MTPKEDRRCLSCKVIVNIEFGIDAFDQLEVFTELGGVGITDSLVDALIVDIVDLHALRHFLLVGCEEVKGVFVDIVDALEFGSDIDRP